MTTRSQGMALPLVLILCSLLASLVLSMQSQVLQQPGLIAARLEPLRQREWAWVGLRAALADIHAPRGDARHPIDGADAGLTQAASLPNSVDQWRRWWSKATPQQCTQGICADLDLRPTRQAWMTQTSGVPLSVQAWSPEPLSYWIEPLLMTPGPGESQLVFRITVRSGPQIWQGWWLPTVPLSNLEPQGEWLSLFSLEDT